jgi:serine/threonine protein kinase
MKQADEFLAAVARSGLLSEEQIKAILDWAPADQCSDAASMAKYLVKIGRLSSFQAKQLLRGQTFGLVVGAFQVLSPLGKGGMSEVFLARDGARQLLAALKILPPARARRDHRFVERFRREMDVCSRILHPNFPQVYDMGEADGIAYIAMEFIPGVSVRKLVHSQGPLAPPRAARLFAEVASALEFLHGQGIIHRDLKSSNILVTARDRACLLDFGLALFVGEPPSCSSVVGGNGYIVGSMDYLAPEQAEDAFHVDGRSDIYGLGCCLYYALTGALPFPGGTSKEKILRHRKEEPIPPTRLNPNIPSEYVVLLQKMMAKRPEARLGSAAQLRQTLLSLANTPQSATN